MTTDTRQSPAEEFLAKAAGCKEVDYIDSPKELIKMADKQGYKINELSLAEGLRSLAARDLKARGIPDWAINSTLAGEAVCW